MTTRKITEVFSTSPKELKESIVGDIKYELNQLSKLLRANPSEEYLTRKEVAKTLKISLVTLHDWNKKEILNPYRIGNCIRYKKSELDEALISINSKSIKDEE